MKLSIDKWKVPLLCATLIVLSGSVVYSATPPARQITAGQKDKVKGMILSRHGDLVTVINKKSGEMVVINLFEDTKIERKKGNIEFFRHPKMDATAMLPGLTIEAEGIGNEKGQLDAKRITFTPDEFAIEIAEEQQIRATLEATRRAQSTADKGTAAADQAQASATAAQSSADGAQALAYQAGKAAQTADDLVVLDTDAIRLINNRVSDLDGYKNVAEASIYFDNDKAILDSAAKQELDQLAGIALAIDGYMIEITGYASSPGAKKLNQKLSEERAAAVADYLREQRNVPVRRILAPAGMGATHLFATKADPQDRAVDRRVDVKVLVNKALCPAE